MNHDLIRKHRQVENPIELLCMAVLIQAQEDAQAGSIEAAIWLESEETADTFGTLCDIDSRALKKSGEVAEEQTIRKTIKRIIRSSNGQFGFTKLGRSLAFAS